MPLRGLDDQKRSGREGLDVAPAMRKGGLEQQAIFGLEQILLTVHLIHKLSLQTDNQFMAEVNDRLRAAI